MIRLAPMTIISLLISFGAISKNDQASKLLNHVTEEHHEHVHGHKHHSDDSEDTTTKPHHSHAFELSVLALSMSFISSQHISFSAFIVKIEQKIENLQCHLNVCHFTSAVFRPPIS